MVVCLAAIGVGGFLYFTKIEIQEGSKSLSSARSTVAPAPLPPAKAAAPAAPSSAAPPTTPAGEKFAAEAVPFVGDRARFRMASEYVLAAGDKALALTISGVNAIAVGQPNEDAARTAALEQCQKYADAVQPSRKCEIYAVNGTVVYPHGRPPMPPLPWARRDPLTERPFSAKDMPIVRDIGKTRLETLYSQARKAKSIAIGPGGQFFYNAGLEAAEGIRCAEISNPVARLPG